MQARKSPYELEDLVDGLTEGVTLKVEVAVLKVEDDGVLETFGVLAVSEAVDVEVPETVGVLDALPVDVLELERLGDALIEGALVE